MNKIRYWKKQYYNALMIYRNTINNRKSDIFTRAYNILGEIGDYLFNLEDD